MMKLELNTPYKSLAPFEKDLPDFVVLTGVNGAGKTHLLEAIKDRHLSIKNNSPHAIQKIQFANSYTLSPAGNNNISNHELNIEVQGNWQAYKAVITDPRNSENPNLESMILSGYGLGAIIQKIASNSNKNALELNKEDFYNFYPLYNELSRNDIFHQNLATIFKRYHDTFEKNEYNEFRNKTKGNIELSYQNQEDLLKIYGEAPWNIINKILEESQLDYCVNSPIGNQRDSSFELRIRNKNSGIELNFENLSSGEKILMSLVMVLYNKSLNSPFPDILLLDEPDASLHPSMAKQFLDVIQKVFVDEMGLKVIMTTHSPSTVALAPEEAIYIMNKVAPRLEKASKDKALRILTANVPSFSVNYENRRQVFVESPYDVAYYEGIYNILLNKLEPEISLSFISSGDSRTDVNGDPIANCDQVKNIVNTLRKSGNKFIWGIIDYDGKNKSDALINVLGQGNRYSIENYILDPLLIAALLLRDKLVPKSDLGLSNDKTFYDFKHMSSTQLQPIVDSITTKVATKISNPSTDKSKVTLLNGVELEIPNWYLMHQGHSLEKAILDVYPSLNSIKRNDEKALKMAIINKVLDDAPELMSIDFLNVFKAIQEG